MTGLSLTVLGCCGTYAGAGGACSGYLLRTEATTIWVDCGPGTLANVQEHVALTDLDALVISHSHPDHWLELPVLANALRYGVDAKDLGLRLLWTQRNAELMARLGGSKLAPTFAPEVVADGATASVGDVELRFARTDHPVETLAVRADSGGRSIAYSADTGPRWALTSLGDGVDLAVLEATLDEHEAGQVQHLTGRQAGRIAAEGGARSLLLTHLAPGTDPARRAAEAAEAFDGPIEVAETHRTYVAGGTPQP
ncbi:MAG: MBL fold metallo-hydrolase [Acidimicrobiia bacterium]